jgi:uncharacterized SAM-binding protein YcdF (DUF218 family)
MSLAPLDRPRPRRGVLAILLLTLYCLAAFWLGALLRFIDDIIALPTPDDARVTDAIVVLTGGAERIETGLRLLQAGKAKHLFITGVHKGVSGEMLAQLRVQYPPQLFACCVTLGQAAEDTVGNAAETAVWVQKEGHRTLRLVTAAYHLPRSLVEFRRFMPKIEFAPHPVYTENVRLSDWWRRPGTARLLAGEFNKYVVSLVRARLVANRRWAR